MSKYKISNNSPMTIWIPNDKDKFDSPHLVRADGIELIGNEIFFYLGKELIFKIWLKDGKWQNYKTIKEAIKGENIKIF